MSRFYASIKGQRGEATRTGSEGSGITTHTRGWNLGVRIEGFVNERGMDAFNIYVTGGSTNPQRERLIATVEEPMEIQNG